MNEFAGKNILVLGGIIRERVDPFRFYSNGTRPEEQAFTVAAALVDAGANVTFIGPNMHLKLPEKATAIHKKPDGSKLESTRDLLQTAQAIAQEKHFDAVLQLANIPAITCPAPSTTKLQKKVDQAQLFKVAGNVDLPVELQSIFGTTPVAGYTTAQEWFSLNQGSLLETSRELAERSLLAPTPAVPSAPSLIGAPAKTGSLRGMKILVNTSRTEEPLTENGDYITNFFSGRQGQSIARAFAERGAEVVLVSGPTHLSDVAHPNVRTIHVHTAKEMCEACLNELPAHAFVGSAAVADFGVVKPLSIRLTPGQEHELALGENPNIVGSMAKHPTQRPQVVVSFAAQSPAMIIEYAQKKFKTLGVELTVANPIGDSTIAATDPTKNQVIFITGDRPEDVVPQPVMGKDAVGDMIVDLVADKLLHKPLHTPFNSLIDLIKWALGAGRG